MVPATWQIILLISPPACHSGRFLDGGPGRERVGIAIGSGFSFSPGRAMCLCPSTPGRSRNSKPRRAHAVGAGHALVEQQRKGRNSRKPTRGWEEINQKTLGGSWHRTKQHLSGSSKQHLSTNEQEGGSKASRPNLKSRTRSNNVPNNTQISFSCQLESHLGLLPFPGVQCFLMQDLYSHTES